MCQWVFPQYPSFASAGSAGKRLMIHSTSTGWKKCSAYGLLWPTISAVWSWSDCLLLFKCVPRLEHSESCWADRTACVTIILDCMLLASSMDVIPVLFDLVLFFLSALLTWYLLSCRRTYTTENGAAFILHGMACLIWLCYPMVSLRGFARALLFCLHL